LHTQDSHHFLHQSIADGHHSIDLCRYLN
jgi:hypothetical protein